MFFRGRFFIRTILVLLLIGIFASVAGRWSYDAGWSDGFYSAQASDGETVTPPGAPRTAPHRGWGFGPIGWFFGGLLKFWLFLLFAGIGLKLLAWTVWGGSHHRRHKGPPFWRDDEGWDDDRHEHWRGPRGRGEPREKGPEDVEPDIRGV